MVLKNQDPEDHAGDFWLILTHTHMSSNVIQFTCWPAATTTTIQQLASGIISNPGSVTWRCSVHKMRWQPTKTIVDSAFADKKTINRYQICTMLLGKPEFPFYSVGDNQKRLESWGLWMIWKYCQTSWETISPVQSMPNSPQLGLSSRPFCTASAPVGLNLKRPNWINHQHPST